MDPEGGIPGPDECPGAEWRRGGGGGKQADCRHGARVVLPSATGRGQPGVEAVRSLQRPWEEHQKEGSGAWEQGLDQSWRLSEYRWATETMGAGETSRKKASTPILHAPQEPEVPSKEMTI